MEIEKLAKWYVVLVIAWIIFIMAAISAALFLFAKWLKVI